MSLWYSKRGAKEASKDEVSEDEAKEVHRSMRKAAGLFTFVHKERGKLIVSHNFDRTMYVTNLICRNPKFETKKFKSTSEYLGSTVS